MATVQIHTKVRSNRHVDGDYVINAELVYRLVSVWARPEVIHLRFDDFQWRTSVDRPSPKNPSLSLRSTTWKVSNRPTNWGNG